MEGKIVVQEHKRRGLPGHVGSPAAHGDADVGAFEGRSVVDPVPGHGHHFSQRFERIDDPELLFGNGPGENGHGFQVPGQLGLVQLFQVLAHENPAGVVQPDLGGDVCGRAGIVSGDHDDADAGIIALPDSGWDGRTYGVVQAQETPGRKKRSRDGPPGGRSS